MIGFDLSYPNPIHFLRRISKADGYDVQTRTIAKYFLEMTIVDHSFLGTVPSLTAAAATWLARKVLARDGDWVRPALFSRSVSLTTVVQDANLVHYSTYSEEELLPTAQRMLDFVVRQLRSNEAADAPNFLKVRLLCFVARSRSLTRHAEVQLEEVLPRERVRP
jgi:G2/mitotic-specific cyclin 1/2